MIVKDQIDSLNLLDLLNDEINIIRSVVKKVNYDFDGLKLSNVFDKILNILDLTFDELEKIPVSIERNEITVRALDLELYGSEIIKLCIDELYDLYIKKISKKGLELLSKSYKFTEFLKWERKINISGYYSNFEKYQIQLKRSELDSILENLVVRNPESNSGENISSISNNEDSLDNYGDLEKRNLQQFIIEVKDSLKEKKKLKLTEYFTDSTDIDSVYRLYAIFQLESENKLRIMNNLEVEQLLD